MNKRIRVLVVEDSLTIRRVICEVLLTDPDLDVVGEAVDGKQAIELCQSLRPDVITMDIVLPVMSGLAATEYIMAHFPTPILIVSASMNRGDLFKTYETLAAGAVDVLEKPSAHDPHGPWMDKLIEAVKLVSRIKVITHLRGRIRNPVPLPSLTAPRCSHQDAIELIAIGASTGGPVAIMQVLTSLPESLLIPIVFVLHIDEPFGVSFAQWLEGQVGRPVAYASDGESITSARGRVVMARPGHHLVVENGRFRLLSTAPRHSCRPSIDVLFDSIAKDCGARAAAGLLTGMGKDGASGLLAIRRAGGLTIAQDEETSVVYGMPREAVLLGAAECVLPLHEIGPCLASVKQPEEV